MENNIIQKKKNIDRQLFMWGIIGSLIFLNVALLLMNPITSPILAAIGLISFITFITMNDRAIKREYLNKRYDIAKSTVETFQLYRKAKFLKEEINSYKNLLNDTLNNRELDDPLLLHNKIDKVNELISLCEGFEKGFKEYCDNYPDLNLAEFTEEQYKEDEIKYNNAIRFLKEGYGEQLEKLPLFKWTDLLMGDAIKSKYRNFKEKLNKGINMLSSRTSEPNRLDLAGIKNDVYHKADNDDVRDTHNTGFTNKDKSAKVLDTSLTPNISPANTLKVEKTQGLVRS